MSILIKGTTMPSCCWDCPIKTTVNIDVGFADGCELLKEMIPDPTERLPDCPLVELPPHGDLISREWLIDIALHLMNTAKNDDIANGVKWLLRYIVSTPTIIEAEGEE